MNQSTVMNDLLNLDSSFSIQSQTLKIAAWENFLADDAVMVTGGHREYLIGKDNILNSLKGLYNLQDLVFIWEPKLTSVSNDGTMGYTSGIYTRTYTYKEVYHKEIGKYTTVWKKVNDEWKIALDIGNEEKVNES